MNTKPFQVLALRLLFLMGVYSVLRLVFMLAHGELYTAHSVSTLLGSFVHGLRFDWAALCWINSVFLIITVIPRFSEKWERGIFFILNGSFLIASINDIELFTFNGKRLSIEFFSSLGEDLWQQLLQVMQYYWYLPFIGITIAVLLWWMDSSIGRKVYGRQLALMWAIPSWIVLVALCFISIRGGLQHKSIHVQSAFVQGANELGHLTLNTPYHFLRTFNTPKTTKKMWFSEEELRNKLIAIHQGPTYPGHPQHNVVLLILESVSLEYFEEGFTPFLKELAAKGALFPRHFANGRRSIEVLSSLFDGVPSVQQVPFSKSNAQGMPLEGVATRLKDSGYATTFFHGAARGSMGFEAYALSHGIQRYYSRDDYSGPSIDFDGQWGIFDGPYLQFANAELGKLQQPFFAGIFTLSSHQPYALPAQWRGKFPKGTLEIHESVGYVDQMLREFFAAAEKSPWYKNTLFVITADHTQKLATKKFQNSLGLYRVPLILFHPTVRFAGVNTEKTTQHVDVPATILDFLDVADKGLNLAGESAFVPGEGRALQFLQPGWQYVKGQRVVRWVENETPVESQWNPQNGEIKSAEVTHLQSESQLFIQYLHNGFQRNRWPFVCGE
jgi:phosphoglycerol transferase MdoB-like AlkP superfamily enzyme